MTRGWWACLGKTGTAAVGFGLRITIEPTDRYTSVDNFYCWFSIGGHTVKLKIEYSTIGNKTTFTTLRENLNISGWSGANDITFSGGTFGGGSNQTSNRYAYRFTFMTTAIDSNFTNQLPSVSDIRLYGDNAWSTPNSMMLRDHIYNWDTLQNVSFPAKVTASNGGFVGSLSGNASSATKATQDSTGQQINTTYIKGLSVSGRTITYTKGDGNTGTITTQDTDTWRGIQNNLTSDSTTDSLSAAQGKALKTLVDGKAAANHTHSEYAAASHTHNYLPLGGGTMSDQAWIAWPDTGNWNNSNAGVTFPVRHGGLQWTGQSDWIKIFSEESASDMLDMVMQFGDDGSSALKIRHSDGNDYVKISATGRIDATSVYGAVWNDYAEFRICNEDFKPGQVVLENGDDTLSITNQRLQRGCSIISDTFGFAIGETDEAKCPIAVTGRVLAYPFEPIEEFRNHIGYPVCSGPNGTVSIMTEEEEEKYPSRIIGTISAIPDYKTWGSGNVEVKNRVWIKVK